ncbi:MAG: hypothetical protein AVDCRST_MAG41-960, partial [uncultured Corynebacteriales bacterium]
AALPGGACGQGPRALPYGRRTPPGRDLRPRCGRRPGSYRQGMDAM